MAFEPLRVGDRGHRVHRPSTPAPRGSPAGAWWRSPRPRPRAPSRPPRRSARSAPTPPPRSWSPDPDVDVVHICTPNHLHRPLAEAALAAGKHVVCEKPLALDAAEAETLVATAAEAGGQAAVPFVYRYYPTVREARERVAAGQTGRGRT